MLVLRAEVRCFEGLEGVAAARLVLVDHGVIAEWEGVERALEVENCVEV
jgi:hypothetical protein